LRNGDCEQGNQLRIGNTAAEGKNSAAFLYNFSNGLLKNGQWLNPKPKTIRMYCFFGDYPQAQCQAT